MAALDGKIVLITGCARYKGLGRGMALAFARAGADLALTDLEAGGTRNVGEAGEDEAQVGWHGLESLAAEIAALGRRALTLVGDVSQRSDAERLVQQTLERYGRIDVLVNNAGAPHGADRTFFWEVPEEAYDLVMGVNARGCFLMSAAVTRHLLARGEGGRIISIASVLGKVGWSKRAAYSASKFAIVGLTQAFAQELAPHGITVNAICPGSMDTARNQSSRYREEIAPDEATGRSLQLIGAAPVGRLGQADDVARLAVFLADPASDFITGQSINVDGGLVMH
jgi:NAD(P)-dependent dehydrogenase (short-subunit alcohol dehydrogenase family)